MDTVKNQTQSSLNISQEVVATIAINTVKEVEGVYSLANLPDKLALIKGAAVEKPIKINLSADTTQVAIGVVLDINYRIKDVCEKIQSSVKDTIQNMTGITVSKVNVFVSGVNNTR